MSDVTRVIEAIQRGDPKAAEELLPLVYGELRRLAASRMANEAAGNTLQPTALVHEAWLRLAGNENQKWDGRAHFFAAAAEAMRRILVESARRKRRLKHGGELKRVDVDDVELPLPMPDDELLTLAEKKKLSQPDTLRQQVERLPRFRVELHAHRCAPSSTFGGGSL